MAQKFWKILGFQKMINSHNLQLVKCYVICSIATYLDHIYVLIFSCGIFVSAHFENFCQMCLRKRKFIDTGH